MYLTSIIASAILIGSSCLVYVPPPSYAYTISLNWYMYMWLLFKPTIKMVIYVKDRYTCPCKALDTCLVKQIKKMQFPDTRCPDNPTKITCPVMAEKVGIIHETLRSQ